jgi:hypothetical protein
MKTRIALAALSLAVIAKVSVVGLSAAQARPPQDCHHHSYDDGGSADRWNSDDWWNGPTQGDGSSDCQNPEYPDAPGRPWDHPHPGGRPGRPQ